jgi:pyruvate/2-oxoglutarate dehydrogenase complex dihydrolipoamide dehydrogenase (E3) component
VREVVDDVCSHVAVRERIDALGVTIHERAGTARFADPHTIVNESGLQLEADKIIICIGGASRRLPLPGFELTSTHSDAWNLTSVPPSMLVVGGGDTGLQVASSLTCPMRDRSSKKSSARTIIPKASFRGAAAVNRSLR